MKSDYVKSDEHIITATPHQNALLIAGNFLKHN